MLPSSCLTPQTPSEEQTWKSASSFNVTLQMAFPYHLYLFPYLLTFPSWLFLSSCLWIQNKTVHCVWTKLPCCPPTGLTGSFILTLQPTQQCHCSASLSPLTPLVLLAEVRVIWKNDHSLIYYTAHTFISLHERNRGLVGTWCQDEFKDRN